MSDEPEIVQDPGIPGWKPPPEGPEEARRGRTESPPDTGHPDADEEGHRSADPSNE